MVRKYPDMTQDHLTSLLSFRGDMGRGDVKQVIILNAIRALCSKTLINTNYISACIWNNTWTTRQSKSQFAKEFIFWNSNIFRILNVYIRNKLCQRIVKAVHLIRTLWYFHLASNTITVSMLKKCLQNLSFIIWTEK